MSLISQQEYKERRDRFTHKLSNNSVAVLLSAKIKTRSNDTEYPFRQESNFYYLSGFKEDNSCLVFVKAKRHIKTILFVQKREEALELWTGERLGVKRAKKEFFVDEIYTIDKFEKKIETYVKNADELFYDIKSECEKISKLKKAAKKTKTHKDIYPLIHELRLIKSLTEIELIKSAIDITKQAHHHAMSTDKVEKYEYELQADIEYIFKKNGAYSDAYTSIVACGNSANTLHYIKNDKPFVANELILIDAGCEYEYYASDITRTIPVTKRFSEAQKELYNMVLEVQHKIMNMIKPGVKRSKLQKKSEELLTKKMVEFGILKGDAKKLIKEKKHKKYYPHGIGHWLGIDVHDQAPYKYENQKEIPLQSGMVLTIEPGIYIDINDKDVPEKYRGIGIRIEDDILVLQNGYENLSADIVKTIEDIEAMGYKANQL